MLNTLGNLQSTISVDLTEPNGRIVATILITAATAEAESVQAFPLEARTVAAYFNGEDRHIWPSTSASVWILASATCNRSANAYESLDGQYVRNFGGARVTIGTCLPPGPELVRATYIHYLLDGGHAIR